MILYHGSNTVVNNIDINKCKPHKDFGRGFYLTSIRAKLPFLQEEYTGDTA